MTEEEAAKLAEECNGENINGELFYMTTTQLAMFADSVQLDEREACAKTCGTCKFRGKEEKKQNDLEEPTGFFLCDRIKHCGKTPSKHGEKAVVIDGSGYYAALCVESDFGCVLWEASTGRR